MYVEWESIGILFLARVMSQNVDFIRGVFGSYIRVVNDCDKWL